MFVFQSSRWKGEDSWGSHDQEDFDLLCLSLTYDVIFGSNGINSFI